jgi:small subunit ribosomal protein S9
VSEEQAPLIDSNTVTIGDASASDATILVAPNIGRKQKTEDQIGPKEYIWGTGRRKSSVARVRLRLGSGKILVNGKEVKDYFDRLDHQTDAFSPLEALDLVNRYDIWVNVSGGGATGQSGSIKRGLSRALLAANPEVYGNLKKGQFLTRDSRMKERKKPGQKGARKKFQFSKR